MFTNFKKAVLATRIRKAAAPSMLLYEEASDTYIDMVTSMAGVAKKIVTECAYLAGKHADAIADAIVTLEPVIKDIQRHEGFKEIAKEMESLMETINSRHEKSIQDKVEVVKIALKAIE